MSIHDISDVMCEWFAHCIRPAAGVVSHPILGLVPTCQPCADNHDLRLELVEILP